MTEQYNKENTDSNQREGELRPEPVESMEPVVISDGPPEQPESTPPWNWYDLVYGILFQPIKTYQRVAAKPPLAMTLALVAGLNFVLALMTLNTIEHYFLAEHLGVSSLWMPLLQQTSSFIALVSFIFNMLWWLVIAALLHLLAEFLGGTGRGITTFTAYGLAGLPSVLMLPIQSLKIIFPGHTFFATISTVGTLAVTLWGIALLVIGLREVHQFSTGRSVLVLLTPWLLLLLLIIILVALFMGAFSSILPILEQLGKL